MGRKLSLVVTTPHLRIARRFKYDRHPSITARPATRLGGSDNIEAVSFRRRESAAINGKAAPKWRLRPDEHCRSTCVTARNKMACSDTTRTRIFDIACLASKDAAVSSVRSPISLITYYKFPLAGSLAKATAPGAASFGQSDCCVCRNNGCENEKNTNLQRRSIERSWFHDSPFHFRCWGDKPLQVQEPTFFERIPHHAATITLSAFIRTKPLAPCLSLKFLETAPTDEQTIIAPFSTRAPSAIVITMLIFEENARAALAFRGPWLVLIKSHCGAPGDSPSARSKRSILDAASP